MAGGNSDADPTFGGILIIVALVIGLACRNVVSKVTHLPYTVCWAGFWDAAFFLYLCLCTLVRVVALRL